MMMMRRILARRNVPVVHGFGRVMSKMVLVGDRRRAFSSLPSHSKLVMPALSPTMKEGVIANWLKAEGDFVQAGQPICEIETDKATVDFEVQDDGYLAKILVEAGGAPKPVGEVIGILVEEKEDVSAFANVSSSDVSSGGAPTPSAAEEKKAETPQPVTPPTPPPNQPKPPPTPPPNQPKQQQQATTSKGGRVFASPLARVFASQNNVDLASAGIAGTGPNGRIVHADVKEYLASAPAGVQVEQQQVAGEASARTMDGTSLSTAFSDIAVGADSQLLAKQLEKSKRDVPHYYLNTEVDLSELLKLRKQLNENLPKGEEQGISVNDFIIRAASLCMSHVPGVNASWGGTFIRRYKDCDINVAIISENEDEILMPVIRNVNNKGLAAISKELRTLLSSSSSSSEEEVPKDYGVGTFTISNLGAYGLKSFTPIIREPQGASLGVGTITKRAVPGPIVDGTQTIKVLPTVTLTLSCDHRVVDGAVGAQWLQELKTLLQNPVQMLL